MLFCNIKIKSYILIFFMLIAFFVFTPGSERELNAEPLSLVTIVAIVGALVLVGYVFTESGDFGVDWNSASTFAQWHYENSPEAQQVIWDTASTVVVAGEMLQITYTAAMLDDLKATYISVVSGLEETIDGINFTALIPTTNFQDEFNNIYQQFEYASDMEANDIRMSVKVKGGGSISYIQEGGIWKDTWNGVVVDSLNIDAFRVATNVEISGTTYYIDIDKSFANDDQAIGLFYNSTYGTVNVVRHRASGAFNDAGSLYKPAVYDGSICIPYPNTDWSPFSISLLWKKDAIIDDNSLSGSDVLSDTRAIDIPIDTDYRSSALLNATSVQVASNSLVSSVPYDYDYSVPATIASWAEYSGDMNEMTLPQIIVQKFPFCIPFDLAIALTALIADPEIPVFETEPLILAGIDGGTLVLDFTPFEPLAKIIRWGILIGFNIGLILATRRMIRG